MLRLDVFGDENLDRRTAFDLEFAAHMLLVILVFDLGAWWLLVTTILSGGGSADHALIAFFPAALLAYVTFIYERQFMTSDPSSSVAGRAFATSFRIVLIVGAAIVTAIPVKDWFLTSAIAVRVHEENQRAEIVRLLHEYEEQGSHSTSDDARLQKDLTSDPNVQADQAAQQTLRSAREAKALADDTLSALSAALPAAQSNATTARSRARSMERKAQSARDRGAPQSEIDDAESAAAKAERSADARDRDLALLEGRIATAERTSRGEGAKVQVAQTDAGATAVPASTVRLSAAVAERQSRAQATIRQSCAQAWALTIARTAPGAELTIPTVPRPLTLDSRPPEQVNGTAAQSSSSSAECSRDVFDFSWTPRPYNYYERNRVLSDLREGRPPRWPAGADASPLAQTAADVVSPPVPAEPSADSEGTPVVDHLPARDRVRYRFGLVEFDDVSNEAGLRRLEDSEGVSMAYWSAYIFGLFVPFMGLITKLLMGRRGTGSYFRADWQAEKGNAEALALLAGWRNLDQDLALARGAGDGVSFLRLWARSFWRQVSPLANGQGAADLP